MPPDSDSEGSSSSEGGSSEGADGSGDRPDYLDEPAAEYSPSTNEEQPDGESRDDSD